MILVIDIGNTSTSFGIFENNKLKTKWHIKTTKLKTYKYINKFKKYIAIIASVVPSVNYFLKRSLPKAFFVKAGNMKLLKIKVENQKEIGADRLVNAYAAREMYGKPAIIIDFGTATTFDILSKKGEYLGGAIAPGLQISIDALHEKTAKLPRIKLKRSKKIIGDSTVSAINSGIFYGYLSLLEGMIKRFKKILGDKTIIIATGGFSGFLSKHTDQIDIIDTNLTLKGLNLICLKQRILKS